MTAPETPGDLAHEVARLEEVARALEAEGLAPAELRDLADQALVIAQRVSALLADTRAEPASTATDESEPAPD
jgi:hypothetical protein